MVEEMGSMLPWLRLNATLSLESLKPTPVLKFNGEQPKLISFVNLHLVQIFMWASVCLVSYYDILFKVPIFKVVFLFQMNL